MDLEKLTQRLEEMRYRWCRLQVFAKNRDAEKAAYCFYDIVKYKYSIEKDDGRYEENKGCIDNNLTVNRREIIKCFVSQEWTVNMIQEFNDRVDMLWGINCNGSKIKGGIQCLEQ